MARWLEWVLLILAVTLAVAANLPEASMAGWPVQQRHLIALLSVVLLVGLLKYETLALVLTVSVLAVAANLPAAVAAELGVEPAATLVALILVVAVAVLNRFLGLLPTGLGMGTWQQRRATEALLGAIYNQNIQEVDRLLRNGVSANVRSVTYRTPLMLAAARGQLAMVRLLLRHGADVNAKDKEGNTALSIARRRGVPEVYDALIEAGAME